MKRNRNLLLTPVLILCALGLVGCTKTAEIPKSADAQKTLVTIMFHEESGIRTFKDLNGRNLMAVPGSYFIPIMEHTYGIKVAITPSDFGMSRFLADREFVQQCFLTNEPYYVRKQGAKVGVLVLSDTGFSPYRVWHARKDFVRDHPDVTQAF